MTYKNSVKILSSNFSLCWKQLLWQLIGGALVAGIAFAAATPVLQMLKNNGFFASTANVFESIYAAPKKFPSMSVDLIETFGDLIKAHAHTLWPSYVGFFLILLLGANFVSCVGRYACGEVISAKMASNASISFTNRLFSTLGRSVSFACVNLLVAIPFVAAIVGVGIAYVKLAQTTATTIALLPVASFVIYLLFATKLTISSCHMPSMIDGNRNPFTAFGKGLKQMSQTRFWRTFSSSICVVLTIVFVNVFIAIFTVGAGLIITIPASSVFVACFNETTFYAMSKRNFYISELIVVNLK